MRDIKRIIALILTFSMILNHCAPVYSQSIFRHYKPITANQKELPIKESADLKRLSVHEDAGKVIVNNGMGTAQDSCIKGIIVIKDIHCHPEAQKNISSILNNLVNQYHIDTVLVEGADGRLKTDKYGGFPVKEIRQDICKRFLGEGKLTGAEYLNIVEYNNLPFNLYGIEDGSLYRKNYSAFMKAEGLRTEKSKKILRLINLANFRKYRVYNHRLREFDLQVMRYSNGKMDFITYSTILKNGLR